MNKHYVEMTEDEQTEAINIAHEVAKQFAVAGAAADSDNRFPTELVQVYKDSKLPSLAVPKKYGGMGADVLTLTRVERELAKGDPAITLAFNMHHTMIGIFRGMLDEPTREKIFREVISEQKLICGPFSEDRAGLSGLADTVAAPDPDGGWRISGKKTWATLCQGADIITFNATITEESGDLPQDFIEHASREAVFILPMDSPGISIKETWDTMGMRATGTHTVVFDNVYAPPESLGGNFRNGLFGEFEWASLSFAAVYLGLAEKALEETIEILKKKKLGATQAGNETELKDVGFIQYNLGKLVVDVHTSARALETSARILLEGRDSDWHPMARLAYLDVTKVATTETAIRVADGGLRLVGGSSFRRGHVLERLYRDARGGPFHPLTTDAAYDLLGKAELGLLPS